MADRQVSGRGRLGRVWQDGSGNFMGSTVVNLLPQDPPATSLALLAAIAVARCLRTLGADQIEDGRLAIKWPNDVLLDGAKLAGILLERAQDTVVIGIGLNLVSAPDVEGRRTMTVGDLPITPITRDAFAETLANTFAQALIGWRNGDWPARIISQWMLLAHPIGTPLTPTHGDYAGVEGYFDGLENDGSLRLRLADGRNIVIHAGEVALIRNADREG